MLPEELQQRALLAQARGGSPVHGVRHGHHAARRDQGLPLLSRGDALARTPHVHRGLDVALGPGSGEDRASKGAAAAPPRPVRAVPIARRRAREARRHRLRFGGARDPVRRARQDHRDRARAAQRRAQADRGMHARRERLRGRLPCQAQADDALPRARAASARQARSVARVPRDVGAAPVGGREAERRRLREAPRQRARACGLRSSADGAPAVSVAGPVPRGERGPLRPCVRRVRALHVADPPLSRSPRAPRDQVGARRQPPTRRRA